MLNGNQRKATPSDQISDDGITSISGDYWDETSWISSTVTLEEEKYRVTPFLNDLGKLDDQTEVLCPSRISEVGDGSSVKNNHPNRASERKVSTSTQTGNLRERNQSLVIQICAIIITVSFQLLRLEDKKTSLFHILSGYYSIMFTLQLISNKLETLSSNLINTDLFISALNISAYTIQVVVCDIALEGWEILKSSEFRSQLWNKIQFALILQAEGWLISRITNSHVRAIGLLITVIFIQVLLMYSN